MMSDQGMSWSYHGLASPAFACMPHFQSSFQYTTLGAGSRVAACIHRTLDTKYNTRDKKEAERHSTAGISIYHHANPITSS
jgi:hypothetical protein